MLQTEMGSCINNSHRGVFNPCEEQKTLRSVGNYRLRNITKVSHRCNDVVLAKLGIKKSDRGIQVREFNRSNRERWHKKAAHHLARSRGLLMRHLRRSAIF